MKPVHIKAKPGDIAERAVIAGDPARVRQLAEMLEDVRLVNKNRDLLTYTGKYEGVPITVAVHGIGGPSAAIVVEELIMLGAKVLVRLGTTGAMLKGVKIGEIIIPTGAAYFIGGAALGQYAPDACMPTAPHPEVIKSIIETAHELNINYHLGPIVSSDAFYAEDPEFIKKWVSRGIIAVEMECATLFALGVMRKVKTGAVLVVSDNIVEAPEVFATAEELREYVAKAAELTFKALLKVKT